MKELLILQLIDPFGANDQPHVVHQRILGGFLPSVNPGYGAWFPADIQASDTVVDLITRLLCSSPTRRLSLKQARKHPWITGIGTETMAKRDRAGKSADSFNTLSPCA
uniref:Protein kinase domain-containing protein n=1 Tax=Spongospora subterranea TaxID=70186 RepID=A0A0H5RE14_9EUKA|eukprot:CRZ12495.1 hypothetical protein [Spongospora subterranea]